MRRFVVARESRGIVPFPACRTEMVRAGGMKVSKRLPGSCDPLAQVMIVSKPYIRE